MGNNTIYLGSDHNGNAARGYIMKLLLDEGFSVCDVNGSDYDHKVDYTDIAEKLCKGVVRDGARGILICGTGTGMLIAANRFRSIRAGLATDRATAELMRQHNDCNVLVLGQWRTPLGSMDELIYTFLETAFEEGRHIPRVEKLGYLGDE
jgi:ribose 5-phosphate isomerase B